MHTQIRQRRFPSVAAGTLLDTESQTIFESDVPVGMIFADMSYSRHLNQRHVNKIAREWNDQYVGVLYLSLRRDGRYACIDGNHRHSAACMIGKQYLPARVYIDLLPEQEAELFHHFQTDRRQLTAMDVFKARLAESDTVAREINEIVQSYGLQIRKGPNTGTVQAVAAMESVYKRLGPEGLDDALGLLHEAWGAERGAYGHAPIVGTGQFLIRYSGLFDRARLIMTLQKTPPALMMGKATALRSVTPGADVDMLWGRILRDLYNVGLRNAEKKLPEWQAVVVSERGRTATYSGQRTALTARQKMAQAS